MSLEEQIKNDIVAAMKAKEVLRLETLRAVKAAIVNFAIEKGKDGVEDADVLAILQKQVKQRRDSIDSFKNAGREDAAEKEAMEIAVLKAYMPEELSDEALETLVKETIAETGAASKADMGKVMKVLVPKTQGRADGKKVSALVSKNLG